jgi:threonylcarbamoyladenosine tRNA methylthiotransferase MtaB
LTGVNIGDYGIFDNRSSKHDSDFYKLLRNLDNVKGIDRFRISSIEPNLLGNDIIDFAGSSSRIAPHFHMPLQSGSDKILRLMKRRYRRDLYAERVRKIKSVMPHACIGADVIVGFPGETEEDFLDSYKFIQDIDVSYLHVFTYSERDETEAASMSGKVDMAVRKKRNNMLRILSEKKRQDFYRSQIGNSFTVLFEEESHDGFMHGFTENYIRVRYPYQESLINTPLAMTLNKFDGSLCADAEIMIHELHE